MGRRVLALPVLMCVVLSGGTSAQAQPLPVGPRAPPVTPAAPSLDKWAWDTIPTSFHQGSQVEG
eukprot:COSAG01_NODE_32288_length_583_cov_2.716942_1_plen_64_part_00